MSIISFISHQHTPPHTQSSPKVPRVVLSCEGKFFQMDPDWQRANHRRRGEETELENTNRRAAAAERPRRNSRRGDASLERLQPRGRQYNGSQRNPVGPGDQRGAQQLRRALSTPRHGELLAIGETGGRNQEWHVDPNPRYAEGRQNVVRPNRNPAGRAPPALGNRQGPQQARRDQYPERRNEPRRRNDFREGGRGRQIEVQGNPHFQRRRPQEGTKEEHTKDKEQFVRKLGYKTMEGLLDKEPSEIVITLAYSSGLKDLLSQQLNTSFIQLICKVLCKACRSKTDRQSIQHLLGIVKDSLFLKVQLPRYVVQMSTEAVPSRRHQYPEYIESILFLLQELVSIFPASSVQEMSMMISVLDPTVNTLRAAGVSISEQIENSLEKIKNITHHLQERKRDGTLRTDTHMMIDNQETGPEDNYRAMTIYPTYNEVHLEERPFLRPNLITERYASTEVYLDTHFRLLREDFVRPLREGILDLLQNYDDKGLRRRKFDDIRVYFNTRIIVPLCTSTGVGYKVQFDTMPLKFVRWQNSKRLLYGSLVCMSKDNFETLLFATVSNRDPAELKDGIVHLSFNVRSRHLLAEIEPSDCFLMVETTAYFEAYRHVLEGLQEIQGEDVPFQKYIVECDTEIQVPRYLNFNDCYDFSALMNAKPQDPEENPDQIFEHLQRNTNINVLNPASWPTKEELNLDESQMRALQMALTKELAIIQGPPGTGKTYVGLKIVQALLNNEPVWQQYLRKFPVLVVCYTNHALDQFLEGIYGFLHTGLVRVGGRSNSELLKRFTLKELRNSRDFRRKLPQHLRGAYFEVTNQMRESEQKIRAAAQQLECTTQGVLHEQYLEKYISAVHWNSLQNGLVFDDFGFLGTRYSLLVEWLGLGFMSVTAIPGADPQNLENADEEQEDLEDEDMEDELIQISEEAELIQRDRMIDDDEPKMRTKKKQDADLNELANTLLAMNLNNRGAQRGNPQDQDGWQVQRGERKKMKQKAQAELRKSGAMTAQEEERIFNIWMLPLKDRWRLYRLWLSMYQTDVRRRIIQHEQLYQAAADRLAELRLQEDLWVLKEAKVVGMTTTGAAKYRKVLQELRPRIVVVEEAAEVLEAHLITTLSSACQHLILIGDHQQLRPSATVYDLARNFYLEVSLFERLVKVNVPYVRLDYQHRMRPEIAALLSPHIYEQLENHPSVMNYENIKGVSSNLFFVEHNYPEEEIQDGKSHQNLHEAAFVVALCHYLICQDYAPSQITILTTYTGQLFTLRKMMPSKKFAGVKVHVVDKYQGEENDIILLSLVRSNKSGKVGFLQIANRVCVALSRAKKGLYCIGNMSILANVPLWSKIMHTLHEKANIGPSLMLTCQNHPKTMTLVSKAEDFNKVPEGGCSLPCAYRLDCGHVCTRACHPYDMEHKQFNCLKPCQKVLCEDGHRCAKSCYEKCGKCQVRVDKVIPQCGHLQKVPCSMKPGDFVCKEPCSKILHCGHKCAAACGEECAMCTRKVSITLKCNHVQEIDCCIKEATKIGTCVPCKEKCKMLLDCGHQCPGSCHHCYEGRFHESCKQPCRRLLICSHECLEPCTKECPPCQRRCENVCKHSKCSKKCGELCIPCVEPCEWVCQHYKCHKLCSEPCDRPPCNKPCKKFLKCKHPCVGLCGEPCPKLCRVCHYAELTEIIFGNEDEPDARFVQLEDCSHIFEVTAFDHYMKQEQEDTKTAIKLKECPKCRMPIRKNLRYGAIIKNSLREIEKVKKLVQGDAEKNNQIRKQLELELKRHSIIAEQLPKQNKDLAHALQNPLPLQGLSIVENKIAFLSRLAELKHQEERLNFQMKMKFKTKLLECLKWVDRPRGRFTEQELTDLQNEIQRLTYLSDLYIRCTMASDKKLDSSTQGDIASVQMILESTKRFTEDNETFVKKEMERLKSILPDTGLAISEKERVMIVKAMGLRQGHWFKCPNGHVYVITECGGAMESAKCPDCDAAIGGRNHTLESSNQVASEMDGAHHSAWSDVANNMLNFEELRRFL
ncbi:NFX1-type zinc finger-containing protein 1 isoform X1 [Chiloscyllium plagiosum]|uniref:NFX1-type zinc finger-containing protein 1 isoform X1 n=2 Tax=Chiloscyllium plagiosum TaxID=36176 RepID=UPI001CB816A2|nr:NFX1-type zinc finger-containing protein 1 isoform X1 [Chiloscyllium plagiosum]